MTWLDPEHLAQADVAGAVTVLEASRLVDSPHWLPTTTSSFRTLVTHGWDGDPPRVALLRDGDRRVPGGLQVHPPTLDNRHPRWLGGVGDPRGRRGGGGPAPVEGGGARPPAARPPRGAPQALP